MTDEEIRAAAVDYHLGGREDDDEILVAYLSDETLNVPVIDRVNGGAWVRAWLWVQDDAA